LTTVIIAIFNEEENIIPLYNELKTFVPKPYEIIWVDDGSTDQSLEKIKQISLNNPEVKCLSFSRNFGHQPALMAGLRYATGNIIITMDGDFQHPPSLLPALINELLNGFDIVTGKRNESGNKKTGKYFFSKLFYKLINLLSDTHIEEYSADFRVFNKKVLNTILQFEEKELFLRGIFSWIGFKRKTIEYNPPKRIFGKTKYTGKKMISLGIKGITSFTFKPLRFSLIAGCIFSAISFMLAIAAVIAYFYGYTVRGWASIIIAIMLLGGIQLLFLGLIGEYIASLLIETKKRPMYIIDQMINVD